MDKREAANQYELQGRELIAQTNGLRVQVLTLGPGQCVPWHHHTHITDTFFCLSGLTLIETRGPTATVRLDCGQRLSVAPGQPHRVSSVDALPCSFVIIQGVGDYDYSLILNSMIEGPSGSA